MGWLGREWAGSGRKWAGSGREWAGAGDEYGPGVACRGFPGGVGHGVLRCVPAMAGAAAPAVMVVSSAGASVSAPPWRRELRVAVGWVLVCRRCGVGVGFRAGRLAR